MNILLKIPHDKLLHILGGLIVFIAALPFVGPAWALALATAVGALKELLYDLPRRDRHTPEVWDALATIAGGAAGFFCTFF